jgi:hypothetical protein
MNVVCGRSTTSAGAGSLCELAGVGVGSLVLNVQAVLKISPSTMVNSK